MGYYRLYFMDIFTGHIARFVDLEASTDEEAIEWAKAQQGDVALELWNQHRKVARFEPQDVASKALARRHEQRAAELSEQSDAAAAS